MAEAKKLKGEPEIGEVVYAKLKDFYGVEFDDDCFSRRYSLKENLESITLLKYEGNGIFTEMYTGKEVLYAPIEEDIPNVDYDKFAGKYNFESNYGENSTLTEVDWYNKYCILKDYPLLLKTYYMRLEDIRVIIEQQEKNRDTITTLIEDISKNNLESLEKSFCETKEKALSIIYGENIIYNFEHGIVPPKKLEKKPDTEEEK